MYDGITVNSFFITDTWHSGTTYTDTSILYISGHGKRTLCYFDLLIERFCLAYIFDIKSWIRSCRITTCFIDPVRSLWKKRHVISKVLVVDYCVRIMSKLNSLFFMVTFVPTIIRIKTTTDYGKVVKAKY